MMKSLLLMVGLITFTGFSTSFAESLPIGRRYKIIRPIFIMGIYDSLNDRQLIKGKAHAYLSEIKLSQKAEVAFRTEVPAGTIVTIVSLIPNPWYRPFLEDRYLVKLDPDFSQGLEVRLDIARGLQGSLDGLNADIFSLEK